MVTMCIVCMKKLFEEFKKFAMRGNVVDLAVAVVMGGAFGKIVTSLTEDIIMPFIGLMTGGIDFSNLAVTLRQASADTSAVVLKYGLFLNAVVTFLIISFAIFMIIKGMNAFHQAQKKEEEVKKPTPTKEQELLTEIRDLLKR